MAEAKTESKIKKATKAKEVAEAEMVVEATPVAETSTEKTGASEAETLNENAKSETQSEPKAAKAGKRSTKGQAEAGAKAEKIEHQQHRDEEKVEAEGEVKPKKPVKPTRSKLERRGKKFRKAAEQIEKGKVYPLAQALELAQITSTAKFDASVELHVNLSVDPRHADQNIRDNLVLPAGTGKKIRVAVFDDGKIADADISGVETITKLLDKGDLSFDVLIATPAQMPKLGKYARTLGPRGLMPNPKSGTVTTDVAKAVKEAKAGRVEYRVDSTGIVHIAIGKVSFDKAKLLDNAQAVLASIKSNKPASVKGTYIRSIHATTTMGPSVAIEPNAA
jgi:large subunit ribosomal protein L1